MQVIQEVRNRTCSSDADCFHYAPCDVYGTHDCVCFPNYEPYTLCSAPSWQAQSDVQTSFYVYKGVSFGLQGLVLLCSLAFLCLNVWRALPTLRKTATGAVRWKRLFSTEQIGLLMVLLSALCDIVYMAVDPYWRQWMVSQPHEAFLFMFGDIFLAFDTVAYGILTMLWIRIRTEAKMGRAWRLPGRVFVGVCMALPFVGVLICFVLRAVDNAHLGQPGAFMFFAIIAFVSLFYGAVIVLSGGLTLRDLRQAEELRSSTSRDMINLLAMRLVVQIFIAGVVILAAVVCLIVFVAVPIDDYLSNVWINLFAPQVVFFCTQLPVLYLFRARLDPSPTASASGRSQPLDSAQLDSARDLSASAELHINGGGDDRYVVKPVVAEDSTDTACLELYDL